MPGEFFLLENHIVWADPFSSENFIHYIDKHTKKEIAAIGNKGQGPNEFSTPSISKTYDNNIFVYDINTSKQAILITDSVVRKKQEHFVFLEGNKLNTISRKSNIDKNTFVVLDPASEESMFRLLYDDDFFSFGRSFLENTIRDPYNLYQGLIGYNNDNNKFVYANFRVSYISIYNYNDKEKIFSLQNEIIEDFEYNAISIKDLTESREKKGCMDMTLSKDFIILLKRDYKSDATNEMDVDLNSFDKLPKTVFLYDYEGYLKHIVNLEMPTLRIAADINDNMLYIITTDPEYVIMEYNLGVFLK